LLLLLELALLLHLLAKHRHAADAWQLLHPLLSF
jgi:hypothetical protein